MTTYESRSEPPGGFQAGMPVTNWGEWKPGRFLIGRDSVGWYVGHDDDRHILTVAGSRAGKGVSLIVPNLLHWPGPCIAIARENWRSVLHNAGCNLAFAPLLSITSLWSGVRLMLNMWERTDDSFVREICDLHFSSTGERLDSAQVTVFRSSECPYPYYEILRLEIQPHIIVRPNGHYPLSARSRSYILHATDQTRAKFHLIPLKISHDSLYAINDVLDFQVTQSTLSRYLLLFGITYTTIPFYFFDRSSLIEHMPGVTSVISDRIKHGITALFSTANDGTIDTSYAIRHHSIFGSRVTARFPCLYRGHIHVAHLRLSQRGRVDMDEDDALNITGLFDDEENLVYYPLDLTSSLDSHLRAAAAHASRFSRYIVMTLLLDFYLSFFILPIFGFQVLLMFLFGLNDYKIFSYFEALKSSSFLSIASLVIGTFIIIVLFGRTIFIGVGRGRKKHAPSIIGTLFLGLRANLEKSRNALGFAPFLTMIIIEYAIRSTMSCILLIYGVFAVFNINGISINFGQTITLFLKSTPGIGELIFPHMLGTNRYTNIDISDYVGKVVSIGIGILFSVAVLGIVGGLIALSRKDEKEA
jgi:Type IV secretory system Conjugative DNA transfer